MAFYVFWISSMTIIYSVYEVLFAKQYFHRSLEVHCILRASFIKSIITRHLIFLRILIFLSIRFYNWNKITIEDWSWASYRRTKSQPLFAELLRLNDNVPNQILAILFALSAYSDNSVERCAYYKENMFWVPQKPRLRQPCAQYFDIQNSSTKWNTTSNVHSAVFSAWKRLCGSFSEWAPSVVLASQILSHWKIFATGTFNSI